MSDAIHNIWVILKKVGFFDNAKLATVVDMESTAVLFCIKKKNSNVMRNVKYQIDGNVDGRLTDPWSTFTHLL